MLGMRLVLGLVLLLLRMLMSWPYSSSCARIGWLGGHPRTRGRMPVSMRGLALSLRLVDRADVSLRNGHHRGLSRYDCRRRPAHC